MKMKLTKTGENLNESVFQFGIIEGYFVSSNRHSEADLHYFHDGTSKILKSPTYLLSSTYFINKFFIEFTNLVKDYFVKRKQQNIMENEIFLTIDYTTL